MSACDQRIIILECVLERMGGGGSQKAYILYARGNDKIVKHLTQPSKCLYYSNIVVATLGVCL